MQRARVILAVASCVLLLIAAWIVYTLRPVPSGPEALVRYFPQREATILYIDVAALRASGILDKLVGSTIGEDPAYKTFIQDTGFDYKRDLNRVMLNSAGAIHYFVLEGKFNWEKLRKYAAAQGGACRGDNCHMKGSTPDRIISWRKLRSGMMALASARDESGARAIEARSSSDETQPGWEVPKAPLWLEVPSQVLRAVEQLPPGTRVFAKALQPAEWAVFTLGPETNQFALSVDVVCRNPEDATVLRAQLEGLTKMLASLIQRENKIPSSTDLSGILTSGRFERQDRRVFGHWTVPRAFVESLGSGT